MHRRLLLSALFALSCSLPAHAIDSRAVVGGAVGGAAGAAIGDAVGGREGAIVGAAAGAGIGAAIGSESGSHSGRSSGETRVIRQESYQRESYYEGERRGAPTRFCPPGQAKKGRC